MQNKKLNWRLHTLATTMLTCALLPFSNAYAIHYQGPLVVDSNYVKKHGNVITGNYQGSTTFPAISITNMSTPIVIANCNLTGPGDLIYAVNSNVTVMTTTGIGTNPNIANATKGMFVHAVNPINLTVSKNAISDVSIGVYVGGYSGNGSISQTITINNNKFSNIDGRPSNGNGGYVTSGSYNAHAIELINVTAVPGIVIDWNEIDNVPFQSQSGQIIDLVDASGTASSPMLVHDNYASGAYPADPGVDAYSGGGILVDGTASDTAKTASAYINIYNNQVVSTANVGIAISAGHNNTVYNNRVVSSGLISNGTFVAGSSAIGMYNWNFYQQPATVFNNNVMHDNVVGLLRKVSGALQRADFWLPGQTTSVNNNSFTPNNTSAPTLASEAAEYAAWQLKLANQGS
jgi:parallel beta-helix repeat protein